MCPCTPDHCRMSCRGSWSPRPSWPPSMSPCPWWRGGRTSWRSARTSWSQPSRPPAASGCLPRSSEKIRLVAWSSETFPIQIRLVDWSSETFQAVNFTFVPQQFRVIYIATCRWIVPPPTVCADFFMKPPQYALSELPKKISLKTPKNHKKNSVCSGWTFSASSREGKLRMRSSRLPCYVFCVCLYYI